MSWLTRRREQGQSGCPDMVCQRNGNLIPLYWILKQAQRNTFPTPDMCVISVLGRLTSTDLHSPQIRRQKITVGHIKAIIKDYCW